jgi:hypothetical protein
MKKLIAIVVVFVIGGGVGVSNWYLHRPAPQNNYFGVAIGDSKAEVQYEIGKPALVASSDAVLRSKDYSHQYATDPSNYGAPLPPNTNFSAFPVWDYFGSSLADSNVEVLFGAKSRVAAAIICTTTPFAKVSACPTVLGVGFNDPESKVLSRLGKPDVSMVGNGDKIMIYKRLNVAFVLMLKKVCEIEVGAAELSLTRQ